MILKNEIIDSLKNTFSPSNSRPALFSFCDILQVLRKQSTFHLKGFHMISFTDSKVWPKIHFALEQFWFETNVITVLNQDACEAIKRANQISKEIHDAWAKRRHFPGNEKLGEGSGGQFISYWSYNRNTCTWVWNLSAKLRNSCRVYAAPILRSPDFGFANMGTYKARLSWVGWWFP